MKQKVLKSQVLMRLRLHLISLSFELLAVVKFDLLQVVQPLPQLLSSLPGQTQTINQGLSQSQQSRDDSVSDVFSRFHACVLSSGLDQGSATCSVSLLGEAPCGRDCYWAAQRCSG